MEITKPNDILVATLNSPNATAYDLMSNNILGGNTSFFSKDKYKESKYIQDQFKKEDGEFDDLAFNNAYDMAKDKFVQLTNEQYIKGLDKMTYSPFDITRPKEAQVFNVGTIYSKDINPFKELQGWTGIGSTNVSPLSLRELAQQSKVFDSETNTWSDESLNELGLLDKIFGKTLVYAQYDEDGSHTDDATGQILNHKKGDWKTNADGNLFTETLGKREIYGKQVVNPSDVLTTDGSFWNTFDFYDSDEREKSIPGVTFKLASQIAPYLIPGFNLYYGGVSAAIGLASVLPTFYKAFEGILMGETKTSLTDSATAAESYLAKFTQNSISDEAQSSFFNYEQLGQMATDVFSQIYEQRAAASLAKIIKSPRTAIFDKKIAELTEGANQEFIKSAMAASGKLDEVGLKAAHANIMAKIPGLKELYEEQSHMAKALNLGYMALVTTGDIYGEALSKGYDRRTAGFAALGAAAGQYGIMMNNRMGDWFLDKTTGYTIETNKALMRKSVKEFLTPIQEAFKVKNPTASKAALGNIFGKMKASMYDVFTSPSELGENLFKHSIIEGVEEVTEQVVLDATKGIIDTMSYLGLTKKEGSFGGFSNVFSQAGMENYLANLIGGMIGGPMFEFNNTKIEPFLNRKMGKETVTPEVRKSIYQLVGNGQTQEVTDEINRQRKFLGNNYIAPVTTEGDVIASQDQTKNSEADIIADNAIQIVNNIAGIMHAEGLVFTNDEIIKKAFVDQMLIQRLEKAKGDSKVGIEGLVLSDYTESLDKLVKINTEIKGLSLTDADVATNKKSIDNLKDEANIYRDRIKSILDGKEAQNYFDQAVFYLDKNISGKYISIDRETYSKNKYGKSYYSLPATGVGLTKERLNKEWTGYFESKNIRTDLETATKAYLEIEKNSNGAIAKYGESGYSEERRKSLKDFLDMTGTLTVFGTSEEGKKSSVSQFIKMAKALESNTGRKVLPWDVVKTNFYEHLLNNNYILNSDTDKTIDSAYMEETVDVNGEKVKRKEIIQDFINETLQWLPADNLDISIVSEVLDTRIKEMNDSIDVAIENLTKQAEDLRKTLTSTNSADVNTKIAEIDNRIIDAESKKWKIRLAGGFYETEGQQAKLRLAKDDFEVNIANDKLEPQQDFLNTLGTTTYLPGKIAMEIDEIINRKDIGPTGKPKKRKDITILADLKAYVENNPIYDGEVILAGIVGAGNAKTKIQNVVDAIKASSAEITKYTKLKGKYDKAVEQITTETSTVEQLNHLWNAVIDQVKNGNLDGELLEFFKTAYTNAFTDFSKVDSNRMFTPEELKELLELKATEVKELEVFEEVFDRFANPEYLPDGSIDPATEVTMKDLVAASKSISSKPFATKIEAAINTITDTDSLKIEMSRIMTIIPKIVAFQTENKQKVHIIAKSTEILSDPSKFISNSIYDFIKEFDVSLNDASKSRQEKLFDILKNEEYSLSKVADITNYLSDGVNVADIKQAMDTLELIKAAVSAMSTTQISTEDPLGFIATRQQFAKANKTGSDVANLKTITSNMASLMLQDLDRLSNKLGFLRNLLLSNSGKIYEEQETIRKKTTTLLLAAWKDLVNKSILLAGNPAIDEIDTILNDAKLSDEQKMLAIEAQFYRKHKNATLAQKQEFVKALNTLYPSSNDPTTLYNNKGTDEISKNIEELSNNDFKLYLVSNLVVNPRDFNIRLLKVLEDPQFDKSPFYTQELAVKIAYATIVDTELFSAVTKSTDPETIQTEMITYLLGDGGTGKTTVGFKTLTLLLQNNNPNLKIWFAAPHADQGTNLHDAVLSNVDASKFNKATYDKQKLFEALGLADIHEKITNPATKAMYLNNNGRAVIDDTKFDEITINENLPDVLFIDEITHFGAHELYLLNKLVRKAKESGKIMKIVGAGDITQKGYEFEGISANVDYVSGIFTPRLSLTVRSLNSQKRKNNEFIAFVAKSTRQIWKNKDNDQEVLDMIGNGVPLAYYHTKDTLNGDFLTTAAEIPDSILETLNNLIKANADTKIAILNDTSELADDFADKLSKAGITKANYRVYTVDNIQGAEADYFIFKLSLIKADGSLASKIRALNTYVTRAKYGTVIINDAPDNLPFNLLPLEEIYTQFIEPLDKTVVLEDKAKRAASLKALLGDDLKIEDDFYKFDEKAIVSDPEDPLATNTVTNDVADEEDLKNSVIEATIMAGNIPDSGQYMVHSFYNDLNAKLVENADGTWSAIRNPGSFYGLEATNVSKEELDKLIDEIVTLKYELLANKKHLKGFTTNGSAINPTTVGEFVIKKSLFSETYNKPEGKLYGNPANLLTENTVYVNLFYKIKDSKGNDVFIHLSTFPKLETLERSIKGGVNSKMYKNYKTFLSSKDDELIADMSKLKVYTSTRLIKAGKAGTARQEFTLNDLAKIPGLRFLDTTANTFSKTPVYQLFPNDAANKESFKSYYRKITFGAPITEAKLDELFDKYKGKVFVAVSFMQQGFNRGTNTDSQVQIIALKSKTRSVAEVKEIIVGGGIDQPNSIRQMILKKERLDWILAKKNSLFNGSQILDLLVDLAINNTGLYESLIIQNESILQKLSKDPKLAANKQFKEFLESYDSAVSAGVNKIAGNSIIDRIAYGNQSLKSVYVLIAANIDQAKKSGKAIDRKALKADLVKAIKAGDQYWFRPFWNIFELQSQLDTLSKNPAARPEIIDFATKTAKVLEDIFTV